MYGLGWSVLGAEHALLLKMNASTMNIGQVSMAQIAAPRVYFNNIGSICTDSLRHGNGLSALLLLTRAAKSNVSAAKSSASKTRSMEYQL